MITINTNECVYTYDSQNRLISVVTASPSHTCSDEYDYRGRRISKTVDGTTTNYACDGDQVIAEYDNSRNLLRKFIYGPGIDEPIWLITYDTGGETGRYWYHYDALGIVIALSQYNSTPGYAEIKERYTYTAFGGTTVTLDGSTGNPYRFTGRRYDPETATATHHGLYYYRARMYAPDLGRFLQPDPIGYSDSMNMYAYVGNNPLEFVDPMGLMPGYDSFFTHPDSTVRFQTERDQKGFRKLSSATDLVMIMIEASVTGDQITELEYIGHGDVTGGGLLVGQHGNNSSGIWTFDTTLADNFPNSENYDIDALEDVIKNAFTSDATIILAGCCTANDDNSIAMRFKEFLPNAHVFGYTNIARVNTLWGLHHAKEEVGSQFVEVGRKGCEK